MSHRICILGNGGSGKSTLAKALGATLAVPVHHLDRLVLDKEFEKLPLEEVERIHAQLIKEEDWVIDGGFGNLLPARFKRATLVVFLDVSRLIAIPRIFKRARQGGQPADVIPEGARAKQVSWVLLKWVLKYDRRQRIQKLKALCVAENLPLLILKPAPTPKLLHQVLENLPLS